MTSLRVFGGFRRRDFTGRFASRCTSGGKPERGQVFVDVLGRNRNFVVEEKAAIQHRLFGFVWFQPTSLTQLIFERMDYFHGFLQMLQAADYPGDMVHVLGRVDLGYRYCTKRHQDFFRCFFCGRKNVHYSAITFGAQHEFHHGQNLFRAGHNQSREGLLLCRTSLLSRRLLTSRFCSLARAQVVGRKYGDYGSNGLNPSGGIGARLWRKAVHLRGKQYGHKADGRKEPHDAQCRGDRDCPGMASQLISPVRWSARHITVRREAA